MDNVNSSLAINEDVIAKMAKIAVLEVEGVKGLAADPISLSGVKKMLKPNNVKGVEVSIEGGVINLNLYIKVLSSEKIKPVCEEVQSHVKDRIQDMTGNAVSSVNVIVADVVYEETEQA